MSQVAKDKRVTISIHIDYMDNGYDNWEADDIDLGTPNWVYFTNSCNKTSYYINKEMIRKVVIT